MSVSDNEAKINWFVCLILKLFLTSIWRFTFRLKTLFFQQKKPFIWGDSVIYKLKSFCNVSYSMYQVHCTWIVFIEYTMCTPVYREYKGPYSVHMLGEHPLKFHFFLLNHFIQAGIKHLNRIYPWIKPCFYSEQYRNKN